MFGIFPLTPIPGRGVTGMPMYFPGISEYSLSLFSGFSPESSLEEMESTKLPEFQAGHDGRAPGSKRTRLQATSLESRLTSIRVCPWSFVSLCIPLAFGPFGPLAPLGSKRPGGWLVGVSGPRRLVWGACGRSFCRTLCLVVDLGSHSQRSRHHLC